MTQATPRVLVLSSAEQPEAAVLNDDFIAKIRERVEGQIEIKWHNYHAVRYEFDQGSLRV